MNYSFSLDLTLFSILLGPNSSSQYSRLKQLMPRDADVTPCWVWSRV